MKSDYPVHELKGDRGVAILLGLLILVGATLAVLLIVVR